MTWQQLIHDNDYEIFTEYPYSISKINTQRIVSEFDNGDGYISVNLNKVKYFKHKIVAEQFIPNPEGFREVDHINRDRGDYHIKNLRWVSRRENMKNLSESHQYVFNIIDKLPDDAAEITQYGKYRFEDLYYSESEDAFYLFTGIQYRQLVVLSQNGRAYINVRSIDDKRTKIYIPKFKRDIGLI